MLPRGWTDLRPLAMARFRQWFGSPESAKVYLGLVIWLDKICDYC